MNAIAIAIGLLVAGAAVFVLSRKGEIKNGPGVHNEPTQTNRQTSDSQTRKKPKQSFDFMQYEAKDDPGRARLIKSQIVSLAEEFFPDDLGIKWPILKMEHRGDYSLVKVKPAMEHDANVQHVFIITIDRSIPELPTVYDLNQSLPFDLDKGSFFLLATDGSNRIPFPDELKF